MVPDGREQRLSTCHQASDVVAGDVVTGLDLGSDGHFVEGPHLYHPIEMMRNKVSPIRLNKVDPIIKPESTERRLWGQSLKKPEGAPLNLG